MRKSLKRRVTQVLVAALAPIAMATVGWAAPSFTPLSPLLGATAESWAVGVSADGQMITGKRDGEAYLYAEPEGTVTVIGDLNGGTMGSTPLAISDNGAVVVGQSTGPLGDEAFRWEDGVLLGLDVPGGDFGSRATAVSSDGSVVIAEGRWDRWIPSEYLRLWRVLLAANEPALFRWDSGWVTQLESPDFSWGPLSRLSAPAISSHGNVVAGAFVASYVIESRSAVWLGSHLQATGPWSQGSSGHWDLSTSGRQAFGYAFGSDTSLAYAQATSGEVWGPPLLTPVPEGFLSTRIIAASGNGEVLLGLGSAGWPEPSRLFVSIGAQSVRLSRLLADGFGFSVSGWDFSVPDGRPRCDWSADGTTLVGTARNPAGELEAFRVRASAEEWQSAVALALQVPSPMPAISPVGALLLVSALGLLGSLPLGGSRQRALQVPQRQRQSRGSQGSSLRQSASLQ